MLFCARPRSATIASNADLRSVVGSLRPALATRMSGMDLKFRSQIPNTLRHGTL
jgi:hypothetical protein